MRDERAASDVSADLGLFFMTQRSRGRQPAQLALLRGAEVHLELDFVNDVTAYCLGLAAQRYAEEGCLLAFMSEVTRYHLNLTDTHQAGEVSRVPDLLRDFNSNLARALNTHYGRGDSFWCGGSYSNTEIHTERSLVRQLLYLWTQPVGCSQRIG